MASDKAVNHLADVTERVSKRLKEQNEILENIRMELQDISATISQ